MVHLSAVNVVVHFTRIVALVVCPAGTLSYILLLSSADVVCSVETVYLAVSFFLSLAF